MASRAHICENPYDACELVCTYMTGLIRHVRPEDAQALVAVLEASFGKWPNYSVEYDPVDHWHWKYPSNPYDVGSSTVYEIDGKIVGCMHNVPNKLRVGEEQLQCDLGSDMAVHPDYRDQGISSKMRDYNREEKKRLGFEIAYYVTSNPRLIERSERRREPFPHTINNYVHIFDVDLQLEKMPMKDPRMKKYGYLSLDVLNRLRHAFQAKVEPKPGEITQITTFDGSYQGFWEKYRGGYDFIVDRSKLYMNWRFCDPRGGGFKVFKAGDGEVPRGYLVLFINYMIEGYPLGYIVDLLADDHRTARSLVSFSIDYFKGEGVNIINSLGISGSSTCRALEANGFINSLIPLKLYFGGNELRSNDETLLNVIRNTDKDRVYLSYGDIDSLPSGLPRY